MTSENPYQSPTAESAGANLAEAPRSLGAVARPTFLAWEKLRLVYVAVLGLFTLLLGAPSHLESPRFWLIVAEGAVAANLCYFAGPIAETYIAWLGYRAGWLRAAMFIAGTLLSCLLAMVALSGLLLPGPD